MSGLKRIRVAIIGTGNIGTDLCYRMLRDPRFEVVALVGRRADSPGLRMFDNQLKHLISTGIDGLIPFLDEIDGAFDATSAFDHKAHWERLVDSSAAGQNPINVFTGRFLEQLFYGHLWRSIISPFALCDLL